MFVALFRERVGTGDGRVFANVRDLHARCEFAEEFHWKWVASRNIFENGFCILFKRIMFAGGKLRNGTD